MESRNRTLQEPITDKHTITIQGIEPGSDDLILSDGGTTIADKRAIIKWEVGENSGVSEIVDIKKKDRVDNGDVFERQPFKETGKRWKGKIKDRFTAKTIEEYDIKYKKEQNPTVFTYDPKIQVNP